MNDPKGSIWRKWDLHVHTPCSLVQEYGGDTPEIWEKFIKDLENLPSEFKVIGINDYLFLDGYQKILEFKTRGRLQKIDLILPVIEVRLKEFVGHEVLRRLNYHIIFADTPLLQQQQIETQFLSRLNGLAKLDPNITSVTWGGVITHASLSDLGKKIREASPQKIRDSLSTSDLELGFNNINFELSKIEEILGEKGETNTYLKDKYFKAIGKSEWEDFRWNGSIADKKSIINGCHFIFSAASEVEQTTNSKQKLTEQGVNSRLLHCSDAHKFSTAPVNERRIGNCFTWIKADPTFEGLRQVIYEPEERVFIGERPVILQRVEANKTKYIKSLKVNPKKEYKNEHGIWFEDVNIEFNKELVAIIGNKGSGKSAVSDILGLLGNTHNAGKENENLSFLNNSPKKKKFRQKGFAENFEATLEWEDISKVKQSLDADIDNTQKERVKYLPQNYFEALTNDLEGQGFDKTLKSVIFLHIPEAKRFSKETFEELEEYKRKTIDNDIDLLKTDLKKLNKEIIALENKKHPDYFREIESKLEASGKELEEHKKLKPKEIKDPSKSPTWDKKKEKSFEEIEKLNDQIIGLDKKIESKDSERSKLSAEKEDLDQILIDLVRFEGQLMDYIERNRTRLQKHSIDFKSILKFEFKKGIITRKIKKLNSTIASLNSLLKTREDITFDYNENETEKKKAMKESLIVKKWELDEEIAKLKSKLSEPEKRYQEFREQLKKWEERRKEIEGDPKEPRKALDTLEFYKSEMDFITKELLILLNEKRNARIEQSLKVLKKKKEILELYEDFKHSIDKKIAQDKESLEKFKINIEVSFKLEKNFYTLFLDYIDKRKEGSFYNRTDGEKNLNKLLEEKNLANDADIKNILQNIITYLESDQRVGGTTRNIKDQIGRLEDFYDFIFSLNYLVPNYELRLDGKTLNELSPGEKGALLLVFYLMIDKEDTPLIIDQPEDNLDNQSVFNILTYFIREAKKKRQIIVVTHNPNLAVGADAEQIVYVSLDKKNKYKFICETGSIENPSINKHIVDILEGTMPAFDKRRLKYNK